MHMCTQNVIFRLMKFGQIIVWYFREKAPEIKLKVCKASNSLTKRVKSLLFCQTKKSIKAKIVEQTTHY